MKKMSAVLIIIAMMVFVVMLDNYLQSFWKSPVLLIGSQAPRPGIYQGRAPGFAGEIIVDVVFEESASVGIMMESIHIIHSEEIGKYWESARDKTVERVLQLQSTDVDTVTGATHSSKGILEAVKDAYKKAVQGI